MIVPLTDRPGKWVSKTRNSPEYAKAGNAEWRWVLPVLGVARNDRTGFFMWSWRIGPFVWVADYRGAWSFHFGPIRLDKRAPQCQP